MSSSFFFSGTEIGFYRLSRARLVLNALAGDRSSRFWLRLSNGSAFFISTVLLGNNLANYCVSLGIVMISQAIYRPELILSLVATPFVFVYGELLPKSIFLMAPDRLMRRCAPIYYLLIPLFLPISVLLWILNIALTRLLGETPRRYALRMSQRELRLFFGEGENLGIIQKTQQRLAENIFAMAEDPIAKWSARLNQFPVVNSDMSLEDVLKTARSAGASWILLCQPSPSGRGWIPSGFYYFHNLLSANSIEDAKVETLLVVPENLPTVEVFAKLTRERKPFVIVANKEGAFTRIAVLKSLQSVAYDNESGDEGEEESI
ncbi:MAG: CNNM domain-containing protein [Planctomycetia bacterium]|nr:CNNM domain-containing protein [Planctomycetia bacterium]